MNLSSSFQLLQVNGRWDLNAHYQLFLLISVLRNFQAGLDYFQEIQREEGREERPQKKRAGEGEDRAPVEEVRGPEFRVTGST